ncbi:MAG: PEP-CTERM sorting domain-containing protein [Phycisphaerae bacterium]|nr:PEP-CTERM sorting domain-containing protein [Phycisphaerae bacterium]
MKHLTIVTVCVASLATGTAQAGLIGINFFNDGYGGYGVLPDETAGAYAQAKWNNWDRQHSGLVEWSGTSWDAKDSETYIDDAGKDTTLSVNWSMSNPTGANETGTANGDQRLLSGVCQMGGGADATGTVTLSSVPYGTYDIIVYLADVRRHATDDIISVTDGMTTKYLNQGGFDDIHTESTATSEAAVIGEGTYVKFSGLTSSSASITVSNNGAGWKAGFAGLQIVSAQAVPEPMTLVLLGLGGVGALIRRRRA